MNCSKHPTASAVNTCKACGCGVCSTCLAATQSIDTICVKCAKEIARKDIDFDKKLIKKLIRKSVFLMIGWIIGITLFIMGMAGSDRSSAFISIVGLLICGLPTAKAMWSKAADQQNAYEAKHGASYTITDSGVYKDNGTGMKLFYSALGLVFGLVVNPCKVIKNIATIRSAKKEIPTLQALLASLDSVEA